MIRADEALSAMRRHVASHPPGRRKRPWRRLVLGVRQGVYQFREPLTGGWLASLAGALGCCLLVWFLGPLLALWGLRPLEAEGARLGGVLGVMAAWGLLNQLRVVREKGADHRLIQALTRAAEIGDLPPDALPKARAAAARAALGYEEGDLEPGLADASPAAAEIRQLRLRLTQCLQAYGKLRGERSLRRLPWYLVIGAPGAGKTTALAESGLGFAEGEASGLNPVPGVAGTRTCDWWFSSEAVLVDTAGRYTSQDSDHIADGAAWLGLLDLLKAHRPFQPVNGVVVAISLEELALQPVVARHVMAEAVYARLSEIDARLGMRLPVYLMLTKADRIAGFAETFDGLSAEARQQVWGLTFEIAPEVWTPVHTAFARRFDGVLARLDRLVLSRLDQETSPERRALIAGFPHQVASLREALSDFLTLIGGPSASETRYDLRGVYFTSAKREGRPLDRLATEVASTFGLDCPPLAVASAHQGGAFFLTRLFTGLVVAESHLAGRGPAAERMLRVRLRTVVSAALAVAVLGCVWVRSWVIEGGTLGAFGTEVSSAGALLPEELGGGVKDEVGDADFPAVLPVLGALRILVADRTREAGATATGLGTRDQLVRAADGVYHRALVRLLLPRLLVRLEQSIIAPEARPPEVTYETLRVYLMLDGEAPLDRFAVTRWFATDWIASLPGPEREPERRRLTEHLATLLDGGPPTLKGSVLIEAEARRRLTGYRQSDQGYGIVRALPAVRELPAWTILDHTGAAGALVLVRTSGKPLTEPVPGLYTAEGARTVVLPAIGRVAVELAQDGWVLGLPMDPASVAARARRLRQEITARYFDDYSRQWRELAADIAITPAGPVPQLLTVMAAVTGAASPLPPLLDALVKETRVAPPEATTAPKAGPPGRTPAVSLGLSAQSTVVTAIQPPSGDDDPKSWWPAAAEVGARFQSWQVLMLPGAPQRPAPLTAALGGLGDLRAALARWSGMPPGRPGGTATPAHREAAAEARRQAERLRQLSAPLPPPVNIWFTAFADAAQRALPTASGAPR